MQRWSFVFCWGLLAAAMLVGFSQPDAQPPQQVVVVRANEPISERVVNLPEFGGQWQTVVVYEAGAKSQQSRELASWIATTPRLQSLVAQTRSYEYTPDHWWVRRYMPQMPVPCIAVFDHQGKPVYTAYAGKLPTDGESLADEIAQQIADCCPEVKPPEKRPAWQPESIIPLLRPQQEEQTGDGFVIVVILCVLSAVAGLMHRPN